MSSDDDSRLTRFRASETGALNDRDVVVELLHFSEHAEAADRWRHLERRIGNTGLTNSWPWIQTWLDSYADDVQPIFAFCKRGHQPIGAALITQSTDVIKGLSIPSIHLGTAGEPRAAAICVERNRLLVAPENVDVFAAKLIETVKQRFQWSELCFDGFVPEHAGALLRAGGRAGLQFTADHRRCPMFDFRKAADEGHPDVISALKHNKTRLRRHIRTLDTPPGTLTTEWAETPEQAKSILEQLFVLHTERWRTKGQPGAFNTDRVKLYHRNLIKALFPSSLIAFRVKRGAATIGTLFNFVEDRHVLGYKSGFAMSGDLKDLTSGLVTHVLFMEQCMRRGYQRYDFLAGERVYKLQLSNAEGNLIWAVAERGLQMWLIDKARRSFRYISKLY